MKLKKIASLMLAGVMAVSMLAGCSGNGNDSGNNGDGTVIKPSTSSIVAAFNDGQDEDNKAKVTFSSDATFDAAVKKAIENVGDSANKNWVKALIAGLTGANYNSSWNDFNTKAAKNGEKVTVLGLETYGSGWYWTENAAMEEAARDVNEKIAELKATTKDSSMNEGDTYYDYTYTGNVSMVAAQQESGATVYYVAYTVTRTAYEQKVTKA